MNRRVVGRPVKLQCLSWWVWLTDAFLPPILRGFLHNELCMYSFQNLSHANVICCCNFASLNKIITHRQNFESNDDSLLYTFNCSVREFLVCNICLLALTLNQQQTNVSQDQTPFKWLIVTWIIHVSHRYRLAYDLSGISYLSIQMGLNQMIIKIK